MPVAACPRTSPVVSVQSCPAHWAMLGSDDDNDGVSNWFAAACCAAQHLSDTLQVAVFVLFDSLNMCPGEGLLYCRRLQRRR
jgi:hypothetical protein